MWGRCNLRKRANGVRNWWRSSCWRQNHVFFHPGRILDVSVGIMILLTKNSVTKIERICSLQSSWNMLKLLYVVCMVCVCAYASCNNCYGFFYHRIVSFLLTANVVWVLIDLFCSPLKDIKRIINGRRT
jgi:hypothetical protein